MASGARSRLGTRREKSSGSIAFSSAVSVGSSWKNWKTTPTRRPRQIASSSSLISSIRRPSTVTVPADGRSMPVIMFMIVDLPLPDGPDDRDHVAALDRQVDAAQRSILDLAGAVDLLDAGQLDQRSAPGQLQRARVQPGRRIFPHPVGRLLACMQPRSRGCSGHRWKTASCGGLSRRCTPGLISDWSLTC